MNDVPTGAVRVWPGSEETRAFIRHPNGTRFRKEMSESVEWPNDSFTKRRIADGTVRLDRPAPKEIASPGPEGRNVREVAAARRPKKPDEMASPPQSQSQPPQPNAEPPGESSPSRRTRPSS